MNSNAQDPNEEIIEESSTPSTPVTSPPTAAVETSSSTGSIQTDNPQSGSVKMAAANFNIPPPAKFDPKADDWDHWIKRYELFEAGTERDGLSDKVRINTLIYVMGPTFKTVSNCRVKISSTQMSIKISKIILKEKSLKSSREHSS